MGRVEREKLKNRNLRSPLLKDNPITYANHVPRNTRTESVIIYSSTLGIIGVWFRRRLLVTAGKVSAAEVADQILDRW